MIEAGVELHEIRHDAAVRTEAADTLPTHADFMGLHSKGMVIDRERVWIGSMNFDPRSANINTEMGVVIASPTLAEEFAGLIERDAQPENSWRVELGDANADHWSNAVPVATELPGWSDPFRDEAPAGAPATRTATRLVG